MQHELFKQLGTLAEGKIWCMWIITDQYMEFSGNVVPNYAPPFDHTLTSPPIFFVFFFYPRFAPIPLFFLSGALADTEQLHECDANQWFHTLTHRHSRQGKGCETSNPNTSSPAAWSIVRIKHKTAQMFSLHLSLIILSVLPLFYIFLRGTGGFITQSSLEIPLVYVPRLTSRPEPDTLLEAITIVTLLPPHPFQQDSDRTGH